MIRALILAAGLVLLLLLLGLPHAGAGNNGNDDDAVVTTEIALDRIGLTAPGKWHHVLAEEGFHVYLNSELAGEEALITLTAAADGTLEPASTQLMNVVERFERNLSLREGSMQEPRPVLSPDGIGGTMLVRHVRDAEGNTRSLLWWLVNAGLMQQYVIVETESAEGFQRLLTGLGDAFDEITVRLPALPAGEPEVATTHNRFVWSLRVPDSWELQSTSDRVPRNRLTWRTSLNVGPILTDADTHESVAVDAVWLASVPDDPVYTLYRSVWEPGEREREEVFDMTNNDAILPNGTQLYYLTYSVRHNAQVRQPSAFTGRHAAIMLVHPEHGSLLMRLRLDAGYSTRFVRRNAEFLRARYTAALDRFVREKLLASAVSIRWHGTRFDLDEAAIDWLSEKGTFRYSSSRHLRSESTDLLLQRRRNWTFYDDQSVEIDDDAYTGFYGVDRDPFEPHIIRGFHSLTHTPEIEQGRMPYRVYRDRTSGERWLIVDYPHGGTTLHTLQIGEEFLIDEMRDGTDINR